ncbi:MAG: hypothetical protein M1820_000254 [Bogoriella megaspora]|nr:MAG: hypothetical protein M1820_000254 [Bogoriella megaspora]
MERTSERQRNRTIPAAATATTTIGSSSSAGNNPVTLRLRGAPTEERRIQWAEDVVDNEGMGKKSSKVCCIYHRTREVGESSDEDSSDSSSDESDSEPDTSRAHPRGQSDRRRDQGHRHHGDSDHCHHEGGQNSGQQENPAKVKTKRATPNAYEKIPKNATKRTEHS